MKNKLEIIARLLKDNHLTVREAAILLETQHTPNYQPIAPNYQPIADWTYRPGQIYCGPTQTSTITTHNSEPKPAYGGC
jgi:hypothetical protein